MTENKLDDLDMLIDQRISIQSNWRSRWLM